MMGWDNNGADDGAGAPDLSPPRAETLTSGIIPLRPGEMAEWLKAAVC